RLEEGVLGVLRVPQVALEIGDRRAGDRLRVDVVRVQILRGAEIGVHGALAVRRDEDVAARGGRPVERRRRVEGDASRADVVGEHLPERVVAHLADEARARAEAGDAVDRVRGRTARRLDRRSPSLVDVLRTLLVYQRHGTFVHALTNEEVILGAGDHVDDGIAD